MAFELKDLCLEGLGSLGLEVFVLVGFDGLALRGLGFEGLECLGFGGVGLEGFSLEDFGLERIMVCGLWP